jgi:hypothetical protein
LIIGNAQTCRTEAEVSTTEGAFLAVVYETSRGWQIEPTIELPLSAEMTATILAAAQEELRSYVNRRGEIHRPGCQSQVCVSG